MTIALILDCDQNTQFIEKTLVLSENMPNRI